MTKRTARFASLPLTLALAVLMTSMTGCGGCSGDPEPAAEESSAEASGASAEGAAKSPGEAGKDEPAAPGADVTEAAEVKPKAGDRVVKRRGEAPGAMDAKAKRLADRKSREADLKKRLKSLKSSPKDKAHAAEQLKKIQGAKSRERKAQITGRQSKLTKRQRATGSNGILHLKPR